MKTKPKPAPPVPRERPIAFAGRWILTILAGTKTQTRRPIDLRRVAHRVDWIGWDGDGEAGPGWYAYDISDGRYEPAECWGSTPLRCPHDVGDRIWVRESWRTRLGHDHRCATEIAQRWLESRSDQFLPPIRYEADGVRVHWSDGHYSCGRLRPSRFMPRWAARIVLVVLDVRAERLDDMSHADALAEGVSSIGAYRAAWDATYPAAPSSANPWVWATSFVLVGSTDSRA